MAKLKIKKRWISILAPKILNNSLIGEMYIADPKAAVGRIVPANLAALTGDFKRQNINLKFKISEISDEKARTIPFSYQINLSFIKKIVRKGCSKIDQSFLIKSSDNKKIRIKPVMLTRRAVSFAASNALHKESISLLQQTAKKISFENLLNDIINYKLQRDFKRKLSKIAPLKTYEIKYICLEKEKHYSREQKKPEKKEIKVEKKEVVKEAEEKIKK